MTKVENLRPKRSAGFDSPQAEPPADSVRGSHFATEEMQSDRPVVAARRFIEDPAPAANVHDKISEPSGFKVPAALVKLNSLTFQQVGKMIKARAAIIAPLAAATILTSSVALAAHQPSASPAIAPITIDPVVIQAQSELDRVNGVDPSISDYAQVQGAPFVSTGEGQAQQVGLKVTEAKFTTAGVYLRSAPNGDKETLIAEGDEVRTTGNQADGWTEVTLSPDCDKQKVGWIKDDYLANEKPDLAEEKETTAPTATPTSKPTTKTSSKQSAQPADTGTSTGGNFSGSTCKKNADIESGLSATARNVYRAVCAEFPQVTSFGGRRNDAGSNHNTGRAIDAMISSKSGWELAYWLKANAKELGVTEVIYAKKIWTTQRAGDGWRDMGDRGSATANHMDHVHISTK